MGKPRFFLPKKKRKSPEKEEMETEPSEPAADKEMFTVVHFKMMMRDTETAYKGIEQFIQATTDEDYDIIQEYVTSSLECEEIFGLIDDKTLKQSELALVFRCFEKILLHIAETRELEDYFTVGKHIVTKLLTQHMQKIKFGLNSQNKAGHIKATLKLLTAMVMLGPMTAILVLNNVSLSDSIITMLFKRHDVHDKEDVRTCLLHLVIAFLLSEDNNVIRKLLEIKDFLQKIFSGLVYDRIAIIELVLSTMKKKIILNTNVSKTAKAQLFDSKVLTSLGMLYTWKGPTKQKLMQANQASQTQEVEKPSAQLAEKISEMVHSFLIEICTSFNHGIIFRDSSAGLPTRNNNRTVTSFLLSLTLDCKNPLIPDLVVKCLSSCPQQIPFYLSGITPKLHPEPTVRWVYFMDIVRKIYESLPKEPHSLVVREQKSVEQSADFLMLYTCPNHQIMKLLVSRLKENSILLTYILLRLVHICASRAVYILSLIQCDKPTEASQQNWLSDDRDELAALYKKAVVQTLPDPKIVIGWFDVIQKGESQEGRIKLKEIADSTIEDVDIQLSQTLCVYQELHPSILVENHLVLTRLIDRVIQQYSEDSSLPQVHLLKLLAGTDARRLPWGKQNKQGHSLMYQLLEMVSRLSAIEGAGVISLQFLCKLLMRTGLFDGFEEELPVWIKPIQSLDGLSDKTSNILGFLSSVLTGYMSNPYPYMDRVSDLVSEAALIKYGVQDRSGIMDEDRFKAILAMEIDDLDGDSEEEQTCSTVIERSRRFPFCPVMLTATDTFKETERYQDLKEYLSGVMINVFHQQIDPTVLCLHVQKLGPQDLIEGLQTYILTWLPSNETLQRIMENQINIMEKSWKYHGILLKKSPKKKKSKKESSTELLPDKKYKKMIETNPELNLDDRGGIDRVQQQLLYLTYMLTQMAVDGDSLEKVQRILDNICDSIDETARMDDAEPGTSSLTDKIPFVEHDSQDPSLVSCLKKVLSHPLVMGNVFKEGRESGDVLSQITEKIIEFVIQLSESIGARCLNLNNILELYHEKVINVLKSISISTDDNSTLFSSVYSYMKFMIKDVDTERCLGILNCILSIPPSDDNFTVCGILYSLLTKLTASSLRQVTLDHIQVENLISRFMDAGARQHIETLVDFFQKFPTLSILYPNSLFESIFHKPVYSRLTVILLQNNYHFQTYVEGVVISEEEEIDAMTYLPILMEFTKIHAAKSSDEDIKTSVSLMAIKKIYGPPMIQLAGIESCDNVMPVLEMFLLLLKMEALDNQFMVEIETELLSTLKHKKTIKLRKHHVLMLEKLLNSGLFDTNLKLLMACFDCMRNCLMKLDTRNNEVEKELWDILSSIPKEDMETFISTWSEFAGAWPGFLRKVLKNFYTTPKALMFLTKMIPIVISPESPDFGIPIVTLFYMVTNHTSFLPVMFNEGNSECKGVLIDLLLELVQISPSLCEASHVSIYLAAYGATMSLTDQKILKLVHFYERQGIDFFQFRPFLWGPEAIEFQMLRKNDKKSLLTMKMGKILTGINSDRMNQTILNFPLTRKLQMSSPVEAEKCRGLSTTYDPCFFLSFFSFLLAPNRYVQCKKFVDHDCLGLVFACLSSHDKSVRSAAYHVLDRFQVHLQEASFQGQEELMYLFKLLRNSLTEPVSKLAPLITVFLGRAAKLLFQPGDHMYTVIKSFLMAKPTLDVLDIPEFYKLFNSSDEEHKVEKAWILSLMQEGLREISDFRIFEKRYSFKILFCFYDSETADTESQIKVLQMVKTACKDRVMALTLYNNHGLLTWIAAAVVKLVPEKKRHITELVNIIHSLWFTLLGRITSSKYETGHLDPVFTSQMMNLLQNILWYFRDVRKDVIQVHLKTLLSVRDNMNQAVGLFNHSSKTARSPSLTYPDILVLLLYVTRLEDKDTTGKQILNILTSLGYSTSLLQHTTTNNPRWKKFSKSGDATEDRDERTDIKDGESSLVEKKAVMDETIKTDEENEIYKSLLNVVVRGTYFECKSRQSGMVAASLLLIQWVIERFERRFDTDMMMDGLTFIDHVTDINHDLNNVICSKSSTGNNVLSGLLNLYSVINSEHISCLNECVTILNRIIMRFADRQFEGLKEGSMNELDRSLRLQTIFATGKVVTAKTFESIVSHTSGMKGKRKGDQHSVETPSKRKKRDKSVSKELTGMSKTVEGIKLEVTEDDPENHGNVQTNSDSDEHTTINNTTSKKKRKSKSQMNVTPKKIKTGPENHGNGQTNKCDSDEHMDINNTTSKYKTSKKRKSKSKLSVTPKKIKT